MICIYRDVDGNHSTSDGKKFDPKGVLLYRKKTLTRAVRMTESFQVQTLEGTMEGKVGDMLMIGVNGEMYPCNSDVFDKSYTLNEPHDDDDDNLDAHPGFF